MLSDQRIEMLEKTCDVPSELINRLVKERHTDKTCKEKYMNIGYAFIIIDLICVRCMESEKLYCKYIIYRSIMYCLIYYETKLCTLSMHL